MSLYQLTASSTAIFRTTDNAVIPADPANTDYAQYLAWVAAGNTPTPVPALTKAQQTAALNSTYPTKLSQLIDAHHQATMLGLATTSIVTKYTSTLTAYKAALLAVSKETS